MSTSLGKGYHLFCYASWIVSGILRKIQAVTASPEAPFMRAPSAILQYAVLHAYRTRMWCDTHTSNLMMANCHPSYACNLVTPMQGTVPHIWKRVELTVSKGAPKIAMSNFSTSSPSAAKQCT
jgi:hypothetical protein